MSPQVVPVERFAQLRHRAWVAKTTGYLQSSEEIQEIFGKYHYTNVWRELDRNTIYLVNNVQSRQALTTDDLVSTIRFRMFNRIDTFEHIKTNLGSIEYAFSNKEELRELLKDRKPNFTASHANCYGLRNTLNTTETSDLLLTIAGSVMELLQSGETRKAWKEIQKLPGISAFYADMLVMDMTWIGRPSPFADNFTPTYKRGSAGGRDYCIKTGQGDLDTVKARIKDVLADEYVPTVDDTPVGFGDRELEHAICEYFKYVRVVNSPTVSYNDRHVKLHNPGVYTDTVKVDLVPWSWRLPATPQQ